MSQKHIDLAKKLHALSKSGVGGEKLNAEKFLQKLMKEHGISFDDIDGEATAKHWFEIDRRFERLFTQLVVNVCGHGSDVWYKKGRQTSIFKIKRGVVCTTAQRLELEFKLDFYGKAFDEEVSVLHRAFVAKHDLYDPNHDGVLMSELSEEEQAERRRAAQMANALKTRHLQRQIGNQ
jgi:hypothetical protein